MASTFVHLALFATISLTTTLLVDGCVLFKLEMSAVIMNNQLDFSHATKIREISRPTLVSCLLTCKTTIAGCTHINFKLATQSCRLFSAGSAPVLPAHEDYVTAPTTAITAPSLNACGSDHGGCLSPKQCIDDHGIARCATLPYAGSMYLG